MNHPRKRLHSRFPSALPNPSRRSHPAWFLAGVYALGAGCGTDASSSVESLRPLARAPALHCPSLAKKSAHARREQDSAAAAATTESPSHTAVLANHLTVGRGGLLASDRADYDQFGWSVAVSGDGFTTVVGAISASDATGGATTGNGAAYVFVRTLYAWSEQAKLIAGDKADLDFLGSAVALSRDGNTALVGAPDKDDAGSGTVQSGAAYLFVRTGTTWKQQAKLVAKDPQDYDHFGAAVALSADGNTALISSTWAGDAARATIRNGAVYVFANSLSGWNQEARLVAKDRATNDFFGISVSLSATGDTALIGAYQTDDAAARTANNGSAYLFERSPSGWVERTKLTAADKTNGAYFGSAVSLSDSGNVALIGAFGATDGPSSENGAAYIFGRSLAGFTQQVKLLAPDRKYGDAFGITAALSRDGRSAFIGAPYHSDTDTETGAVYMFEQRPGPGWLLRMELEPPVSTDYGHFGAAVGLSGDGRQALVGAPYAIDYGSPSPIYSGMGYMYIR